MKKIKIFSSRVPKNTPNRQNAASYRTEKANIIQIYGFIFLGVSLTGSFSGVMSSALVPMILLCGTYFIIYLRGFFIFRPKKCAALVASGGRRSLRELSVSLAGALGVGNIVGVAVAISTGGAGAVFWMWVSAAVSAVLKYCEIILALKFREKNGGEYVGGPMYYMRDGMGGASGKALACIYAALGVVSSATLGNVVQSGAVTAAASEAGVPPSVAATVMCVLCALVVFGGFSGVSRFTGAAVPIMSVLYIAVSLRAIVMCAENIPAAFSAIFSEAFRFDSAAGGVLGFLTSSAVRSGTSKGAFSHEAGSGTAPMAHIQAEPEFPAAQGLLGMIEVVFDTLVMCTLTALVILTSGAFDGACSGAELVTRAFEATCGGAAKYIISLSVSLFAFSTVICWSYYGRICLSFFSRSRRAEKAYLCFYCAVIPLGAVISEGRVWELADVSVTLMTAINLAAVFCLRGHVRRETKQTFGKK